MVSSPAVANGVVYVGSDDDNVYALNASTGAKLWSYATGGAVYSSPAVANGVVYVGSDDGNVYALNASTGAKLWSYATGDVCAFLARSGEWGGLCRLRRRQRVCAERQHRRQAVELCHRRRYVHSSPAVANGVVYVGSADGNVYALNASTGAKLWSYAAGGYGFLARRCGWGGLHHAADAMDRCMFTPSVWAAGRSVPADTTHSDDGPSGRSAHLRLPGMEPGARRC